LLDRGQARSSLQKPPGALGDPFTPNQSSSPWPEGFVRSHRSSARQFPAPNLQVELKAPSGVRCALRGGRASERTQSSVDGESKPRGCFGARGVGGGGQRGGSGGGCSSFDARQLRAALGLHLACPGSKGAKLARGGLLDPSLGMVRCQKRWQRRAAGRIRGELQIFRASSKPFEQRCGPHRALRRERGLLLRHHHQRRQVPRHKDTLLRGHHQPQEGPCVTRVRVHRPGGASKQAGRH